jgi:hypothetical protein
MFKLRLILSHSTPKKSHIWWAVLQQFYRTGNVSASLKNSGIDFALFRTWPFNSWRFEDSTVFAIPGTKEAAEGCMNMASWFKVVWASLSSSPRATHVIRIAHWSVQSILFASPTYQTDSIPICIIEGSIDWQLLEKQKPQPSNVIIVTIE